MRKIGSAAGIGGLISALSLAFFASGCGGGGNPVASTPPVTQLPALGPAKRGACTPVTNTANFNGTAIQAGSWIWFTSVTSVPGYNGSLHMHMLDSRISFSAGSNNYLIKVPPMRFSLHKSQRLHLKILHNKLWLLRAPEDTSGNDYLDGVAYYVKDGLPGGIQNVTWSAKFYSKSGHEVHWQWAAAVYTTFANKYKLLGVKPLDDNHYPPYNSDNAGTPENYKSYVTGGATGGGGANYTGGYSGTVSVKPCPLG